jgi:hypothetical protein
MEIFVAPGGLDNTHLTVLTVELRLPVVIVLLRGLIKFIKSHGNICRSEWAYNTYLTVLIIELRLPVVIVLLRGLIKSRENIYRSEWAYLTVLIVELRLPVVIVLRPFIVLLRGLIKSRGNICQSE